jgi:hypothetical protein
VSIGAVFPGVSSKGMNLTSLFHLVPELRMVELYHCALVNLHGVVLN